MARWTGTWLMGAPTTRSRDAGQDADRAWPGGRLGLPEQGPGSLSSVGRRLAAYAVDALASALVAALFVPEPASPMRGVLTLAVFALEYLVLVSLTGQTLGMRLLGIRIRHVAAGGLPGFQPTAIRTVLLVLLVPALVTDRDGRGLHDRLAGTVVVRC